MADTSKFPTADQVRSKIEKLKTIDWPAYNSSDNLDDYVKRVSKIFTEEFNTLPDVAEFLKIKEFGFKLFRVRELSTFDNIDLVSEHSYPPINLTKLNRCNFPKYPVFYGSNNAMTALAEVVRNDDFKQKRYCISRWTIHQSNEDVLIQPYLFGDLHEDNIFRVLQESMTNRIPEIFEHKLTSEQEEGVRLYLKFMADTFINDDSYALSAFFAHRRFYAPHNFRTEILIYPSVQTLYKGVNIAIHPNFVDTKMFATRFYIVEIDSFDREKGLINISYTTYGTIERSQIKWTHVTPTDTRYQKIFKEDFDHEGEFKFIENAP
jgi:hypothetical protein